MNTAKHIERLVYVTPNGVPYPLQAPPQRSVISVEGFGTPPLEYVTDRAPFQHGDTVRSVYLGPRVVQIVVMHNYCSRDEYWTGRQNFLDTIRPELGTGMPAPGKLLYYLPGRRKRQLDVLLDSGPGFAPPDNGWRAWSFTEALRFTAHDPTWYDPTIHAELFAFAGAASDDLIFPITFPIEFADATLASNVIYRGTWIAYPTIIVTGPVTGFAIANLTTGDTIAFNAPVLADESVTINLNGIKTITGSDGSNKISLLTADSDLTTFSLVPSPTAVGGLNQFVIAGTGTSPASGVEIRWYERYFGI